AARPEPLSRFGRQGSGAAVRIRDHRATSAKEGAGGRLRIGGAMWLIGSDESIRKRCPEINRERVFRYADELFEEVGARRVVRHHGADGGNQLRQITALTDCVERFEPLLRGGALHGSTGEDADLLVTGWHRVLPTRAQLFIAL